MKYDIVIVTYNSARWLPGCVAALAKANYPLEELNLIFADNASQDNTLAVLQTLQGQYPAFGGFQVLPQGKNGGFSAGCNAGARAGEAPLLFFLNADTEVEQQVFIELDKGVAAHPEAGGFECRQLPFETGHHINPVTLETTWASGAALVVRRTAFHAVGGFDEHLFLYCEDVDLSWRLRAAGYTLLYMPHAEVTHFSYEKEGQGAAAKLGEYAGGFYGNLLLRYKFGRFKDIAAGHAMYLGALRRPRHFNGVRRVLAKNYLRHFIKLWPFLFWRVFHRRQFLAGTANFKGGFSPDRGLYHVSRPQRTPLVSVVVRTCGRPATLRETLTSLAHQTYRNFEVIVVEDGPPASRQMLEEEFAGLPLHYYATGQKAGRARVGNLGLEKAKGEYCNFLDDDDYFYPDHIELLVAEAVAHPEAGLVTAASMAMEAEVVQKVPYVLKTKAIYPMRYDRMDNFLLCQSCLMPIQSILFKRSLFLQYGGLNEALEGDEDWSMWLKYFSVSPRIHNGRVDIPRATSLFVVPASREAARARLAAYKKYEDAMLDDPGIQFTVTPRQMRQYYEGFMGDLRHLRQLGKLDAFLDGALEDEDKT
ncbi:MAG: glycosyltransferase family 2 protein [Oscillospiraceae bacterium]